MPSDPETSESFIGRLNRAYSKLVKSGKIRSESRSGPKAKRPKPPVEAAYVPIHRLD